MLPRALKNQFKVSHMVTKISLFSPFTFYQLLIELDENRINGKTSSEKMRQILYVDDSRASLVLTERVLKETVHVIPVSTLTEASERLHYKKFDLILLDYLLADGDGIKFATEIRHQDRFATTPIVLVTASFTSQVAYAAMKAGINQTVRKPIKAKDFKHTILQQIESPYFNKVQFDSVSPGCLAWKDGDIYHEYSPDLDVTIQDRNEKYCHDLMRNILEKVLHETPDKLEKMLSPKLVRHFIRRSTQPLKTDGSVNP